MWSGPRNVSTAFMYFFHHRGDCHVIDEPFYAFYLDRTGIVHPGREAILASQNHDADSVKSALVDRDYDKEILFMKNMPHHMVGIDLSFVERFNNFFLIREPRAMIASYIKKIPEPSMSDLGLDLQYRLFNSLWEKGQSPPVVDSLDLLNNPESVLRRLCERLAIPWDPSMLTWSAGAIPQDGAWAQYWYANVHASTGFAPPSGARENLIPAHLEPLVQECEYFYKELKKHT
ncbi:UNVERIFIED_CONTAM: hypothetical protein GTU68_053537 [Idotea baltica]|nr:hypothetical protein [Idotea baltica]